MGLNIINAKDFNIKLKATIQASGRLGFSEETANVLDLANNRYVVLAFDDEDHNTMYICPTDKDLPFAFRVNKAGKYYYVCATALFDSIGEDYKNQTVIFDMTRYPDGDSVIGGTVYKMVKRIIKRKKEM